MNNFREMDNRLISYVNIFLLSNRLQTVMDKGLQEITSKQWILLIILGTFEGAPTLKELSHKCGITHQSTMQLVKKLADKGYLVIEEDKKDKRAIRISFTDKRDKWTDQYAKQNMDFIEKMFSDLSDEEIEVFCSAQFKLYDRLGTIAEEFEL